MLPKRGSTLTAELAPAFLEGIRSTCSPETVEQVRELESVLSEWLQAGRRKWPGISVAPAPFVAFVAAKLCARLGPDFGGDDLVRESEALQIEDLYLAHACLQRDRTALEHLERDGFGVLPSALRRRGGTEAEIEEVLSRLREDVVVGRREAEPMLGAFAGRGELATWLRVCAFRMLLRHQSERGRERPMNDELLEVMDAAVSRSPELEPLRTRFRERFKPLFADAFGRLDTDDRGLLLQHYVDGLTTLALGRLLRVHRVTVSRRLTAARQRLLDGLRQALSEEFGIAASDCDSIIRAFRSQLEVSLRNVSVD